MTSDDLYSIGWRLTAEFGVEAGPMWKVEDQGSMEVWAGERYFVVSRPESETFIVTEESESDPSLMDSRRGWLTWQDAARDLIERIGAK